MLFTHFFAVISFLSGLLIAYRRPRSDSSFGVACILFTASFLLLFISHPHTQSQMGFSSIKREDPQEGKTAASAPALKSDFKKVRLFCWIMTGPQFHRERADHVWATWAKRCTKTVFVTTQEDDKLPTLVFNISEGRDWLWHKVRAAYTHISTTNLLNEYDYFMKADDNTYVVVENLMHMLAHYNDRLSSRVVASGGDCRLPDEPIYFGERVNYVPDRKYLKNGYPSGGPGYILSREAVKRFVKVIPDKDRCFQGNTVNEDAEIARCVENMGVRAIDVRDNIGKHRMIPTGIEQILAPFSKSHLTPWYVDEAVFPITQGPACCSDYLISMHYVTPEMMYVYDHLIYNVKIFGRDIPGTVQDKLIFPGQPIEPARLPGRFH